VVVVSSVEERRAPAGVSTIAWGVFCACSWTWCIGLYLPKLMLDRYGWWGFVVFAVPNVLGCAGFGYVLARRARSEALTGRHGAAMVVFSLVAIAYHVFFITLLFAELMPQAADGLGPALLVAAAVYAAGLVLCLAVDRTWLILAGLTYLFSLGAFAVVGFGADSVPGARGPIDLAQLAWLAPIIALGFLLCPYLDLTFHRALQRSPSRHAFAVFGATFAVMIVFTCFLWGTPSLAPIALGHVLAQITFTMGAHLREVRLTPTIRSGGVRVLVLLLPLAAAALLPIARGVVPDAAVAGDDLYIRALVFYGLAFPAYVLVFMGPARPVRRSARAITILIIFILLLAPLYDMAFLHDRAWLMVIPVTAAALWLVARLAVARDERASMT
jgi:hypothetical protein